MMPVQLPPIPKMMDYPVLATIGFGVAFTTILVIVAGRFDPTGGPLTISLLIVSTFVATVTFSLFFTIPNDEITSAIIGGLVAAFGAVVAHWLGKLRS
jgi:uncharacterized BrkB/YihY/UPF0761 family membrane protein